MTSIAPFDSSVVWVASQSATVGAAFSAFLGLFRASHFPFQLAAENVRTLASAHDLTHVLDQQPAYVLFNSVWAA